MTEKRLIADLAERIKNYRKDERDFEVDEKHVENWISQFPGNVRTDILDEIIYVFNKWYFQKTQIRDFIEKVLVCLKNRYSFYSVEDVLDNVSFPPYSLKGKSQIQLNQMLRDYADDEYHKPIIDMINGQLLCYVYIDDGIFTGKTAIKEIKGLLDKLPSNSSLNVFYIFGTTAGKSWADKKIREYASAKNIDISISILVTLSNQRYLHCEMNGDYSYESHHNCLWPQSNLSNIHKVDCFKKDYIDKAKYHEFYPYRDIHYINDEGIFSTCDRRKLIEKEFLIKGLDIMSYCKEASGMLPLGFDKWASFGLGSICATDLNISNTCPLVLWWGNVKKDGSVLDNWYPLLPRRTNGILNSFAMDNVDYYEWDKDCYDDDYVSNAYSICPDCGCSINERNDGGNGFCLHCAWKH